jgi:5-(carboxyamino)imidazole ribonucleotide synthase
LESLNYIGIIAVELFVSKKGGAESLMVNEVAPRVHNSGHWTEAVCHVSQFEQHIRAIAGWPLGDTRRHSDCVMENLLGDEIFACPELARQPGAVVHDYGKAESREGRKMGHVTRLILKK